MFHVHKVKKIVRIRSCSNLVSTSFSGGGQIPNFFPYILYFPGQCFPNQYFIYPKNSPGVNFSLTILIKMLILILSQKIEVFWYRPFY
jgi:hypothetical protein